MKPTLKSATAMLLFLALSPVSFAQTNRFGISINSLTTNFNYGKSNSTLSPYKQNYSGFQAGFSYQAGISPVFSLVPELYFATKGGILKENNPLTMNKSTLRINSLEMPVLVRLHFNKLYLNAGPYAGYNVGGRLKIDDSNTSSVITSKVTFGNSVADIKRWDFGFQTGAGYNFNLKQSVLTLDVRYSYGLVNISQGVERYNRMLSISLQVSKPGRKTSRQ